jgi:hypothetical protein
MASKARILGFVASTILTACGGSSPTLSSGSSGAGQEGGTTAVCTPGASVACTGPGGCAGGQVCNNDGSALGTCDCGAPSGSASGASGANADSGSGIGSGTSGSASGAGSVSGTATSGSSASGGGSGGETSGGSASGSSSGSASGAAQTGTSSGGMSGSSGASVTCSGPTSQACGNCNSGMQQRSCANGQWSAWGTCNGAQAADLSGVGMGDFTISFDLTDTDTSAQAVVNQRSSCSTSSNLPYWDIRLNPTECPGSGFLSLEHYYNGVLSVKCAPTGGPGTYHVSIHRSSGTISLQLDTYTTSWSDPTMWEGIASVAAGTEVCDGTDGLMPLSGTLTNLCVEKQ